MDSAAQRRLRAISGHVRSSPASDRDSQLAANTTAGEFVQGQGYSVVLPEKLQTGKWNVYRSARSPLKLVSRYPQQPDIGTLHDNFEYAIDTFRDYKYLGTRVRPDGTVGEYTWMTYGEVGTSRSAVGSGLICQGIPKYISLSHPRIYSPKNSRRAQFHQSLSPNPFSIYHKSRMSEAEASVDDGETFRRVRQRIADRSKKVVQTKEILSKQAVQTKQILSKQAVKIAKQAEEHERFINKVTHLLGVLGFGAFCYFLGARPHDVPYVYCLFYVTFVPLRWIYYRYKKWHYYLLDFCYYANTIFLVMLLFYPKNKKLFMICFSFAEGPLAWALIVWRCSLVFSSFDKIVSVLIHLIPGMVFFTIRWWDPETFAAMHPVGKAARISWPYVEDKSYLWTWLFVVPLFAYTLWQLLYFLIVNVLRRQRLLRDPEVMTSYRELSKKAQKANNIWWRLSGQLGDQNRPTMYILLQALFTVATLALTVPIFLSYELHVFFQILKVSAAIWNGGSFLLEVMPKQVVQKEKRKLEMKPTPAMQDHSEAEPSTSEHPMGADSILEAEHLTNGEAEISADVEHGDDTVVDDNIS